MAGLCRLVFGYHLEGDLGLFDFLVEVGPVLEDAAHVDYCPGFVYWAIEAQEGSAGIYYPVGYSDHDA
jgi:hypothetical protein